MVSLLVMCMLFCAALADSSNLIEYQNGNIKFSINVFKELVKTSADNTLVCPLSADIVLAMALMGARGETQRQLATGTHLPPLPDNLKATFSELMPQLQSNDKYTFDLANKIYIQNNIKIDEQYRQSVIHDFNADIESVDFKQNDVITSINNWVSQRTHGKIQTIVDPQSFNSNAHLVLLNAMYFKGQWLRGFKTTETKLRPFYVDKNRFVNTKIMNTLNNFRYYNDHENQVKLLEMSYKGDDVTMTIILPNDPEGLSAVINNLEKIILNIPNAIPRLVNVKLPKFKIESSVKFTEILKSFGVVLPFKNGADFSGMVNDDYHEAKIDDILQKATIEVDETGTVAAAVTRSRSSTRRKSMPKPREVQFNANHPFVFFLTHKVAGITFIGKYTKPSGLIQNGKYER